MDEDVSSHDVVLRRAFELAASSPNWSQDRSLTHQELAEIALEVGLPLDALARSLAEKSAGVEAHHGLLDRLVGPCEITGNRVAINDDIELEPNLLEWLEAGHGLRPRHTTDGLIIADRRSDLLGKLGRSMRSFQGLGGLGKTRAVRGAIVDVGDGAICLVVDVSDRRRNALVGGGAVVAGGTLTAATFAALLSPLAVIGIPVAVGAGVLTSRGVYKSAVDEVSKNLEQTLDGIASGRRPPKVLDSVTRSIGRSLKRGTARKPPPPAEAP